ncbi:MAG: 30S ribosomal protein S27e, partial [Candidatus Woesearchaeota archaeon]
KCKNEQIVFGKASSVVKCLVCGKILAEPSGGKSKVKARILEVLE